MKLKSLMLGVAAAAAATTAQAADLPVAPEPVDYVRVCDAYGARFYYIPGTETCLRVGGRVRTQLVAENFADNGAWGDRDTNGYDWDTEGYLYLDARTATGYGTLRAFATLEGQVDTGSNESFDFGSTFIQWGGLTMGYLASNFDIYTGQVWMGNVSRNWSDNTIQQIAYTAAFGNGFSATIALEDGAARRLGSITTSSTTTSVSGNVSTVNATQSIYGGTRMPDVVAALGVSQGWGSAQLSGALHHITPASEYNNGTLAAGSEDEFGWAIGAGVSINLDMLSSGSNIFFQGFYADGAMDYIGASWGHNGASTSVTDFANNASGNGITTSTGYSLSSGIFYQATQAVGLALDGSYMDVDNANGIDVTRFAIDGSVQWSPVTDFTLGVDVGYADTDFTGAGDYEDLLVGFRMQRDF